MYREAGFKMNRIWYQKPAKVWEEALPLGNGRLGGMVYGEVEKEQIQLNEETMWYGGKVDRNNKDAKEYLPQIRELIIGGKIQEAEKLMKYALSGTPQSQHPYQSLGDMKFNFFDVGSDVNVYHRELDIENAIVTVSYEKDDVRYKREYFISNPDDCMVLHFEASEKGKISFDVLLTRERFYDGVEKCGQNGICLYGNLGKGGFDFAMQLSAKTIGGTVKVIGEHLIVEDADEVTLAFTAGTTYNIQNLKETLNEKCQRVLLQDYEEVKERHTKDYRSLYDRVNLQLVSDAEQIEADAISTDERMEKIKAGFEDVSMMQTYYQFGRYLLISSSRKGNLPATLQGIWNHQMKPSWDSKYTININTQMNYWLAENSNLSECHLPLFELIKKMLPNGQVTAREMYGCRGFVAHHNTDIWGDTAVQDFWNPGSYWVMGAAWLCTHQWNHYLYTKDIEFLKESFPIMRESAKFFLDFLIEEDGYLKTCPSVSPENTYILPSGEQGANGKAVTMDNQILRDLFTQCLEAGKILGVEDELQEEIANAKEKLMPTRIGKYGQIMEWEEDYEELEPGHRHISQLYGLFPAEQITVDKTPELAEAARKTIERRLQYGGGHTGWSRAWIINHYAKLWDGNTAYEHLQKILEKSTLSNLFDNHPPFQIDGNFGAAAGIANMLVQSNEERTILLPALPDKWKSGHVEGLCIVGDAEISIWWKDNKLVSYKIFAKKDWSGNICYKNYQKQIEAKAESVFVEKF